MNRAGVLVIGFAMFGVVGCATTHATTPALVAVMRPSGRARSLDVEAARAAIERGLAARRVRTMPHERVDRAASTSDCAGETACLRALGRFLEATHAIDTSMAELGSTVALRARVIDVGVGGERVVTRVVQSTARGQVAAAFQNVGAEVAAMIAPEEEGGSEWIALSVVSVLTIAATVAVIVLVTNDDENPSPDFTIVPP